MANRRHSTRRIKRLRTYDVRELAKAVDTTPNTIRNWHKSGGLEAVPDIRPAIFRGDVVIAFLKQRKTVKRQPSGPGRIHCVKCREPKRPAFGEVEYRPISPKRGMLVGLCPDCTGLIYRSASMGTLATATVGLTVSMPKQESSLDGMPEPFCNDDSERD